MSARKRVVIYVDEDGKLDVVSSMVPDGVVLEVRTHVREGTRHFTDPVVLELTSSGAMTVDTRL